MTMAPLPDPLWGHMEICPDHGWEKVGQGVPPRRAREVCKGPE
jgi:hypothetical protein